LGLDGGLLLPATVALGDSSLELASEFTCNFALIRFSVIAAINVAQIRRSLHPMIEWRTGIRDGGNFEWFHYKEKGLRNQ
jgi:hypothetical protein